MAQETLTIEARDSNGNVINSMNIDVSTNETIEITSGNG
jgi:hypothetical protein